MKKPALAEKDFLNPEEAIELFDLSRKKFYRLIKEEKQLGFIALYGSRRLIIRVVSCAGENPSGQTGNISLSTT